MLTVFDLDYVEGVTLWLGCGWNGFLEAL